MTCPILYFPKKTFQPRGKPTEEIHVNQKFNIEKNIMPFCFSHMSYLSLDTELVARESKKQATVTVIT